MDKVLKFKLWGDYAHFKKYYTTTSPLTFEFPPPPTIIGIVSAIIGFDKKEYLYYFQEPEEFKISIKLDRPVKKVRWTQNLIDTKRHFWKIHNRTQIRTEFLKDPSYIIYFWHKEEKIYNDLKKHLKNHTSAYSISLGLSELLANFEYHGESDCEKRTDPEIQMNSVIPEYVFSSEKGIDFEIGKEIFRVNLPVIMNPERVVRKRANIFFERNCKTLKCNLSYHYQLDSGEKIVFF